MKHLKPYNIFESQEPQQHPGFPTTEKEIHKLCKYYNIENYTINDDLSIDVDGDVNLAHRSLKYLPLKFNYINENFNCSYNNLISLIGSPIEVERSFDCSFNNLKSLEGGPNITDLFYCDKNHLKSLKGGPKKINNKLFRCSSNELMTLEYVPSGIDYTHFLTDFRFNPIYSVVSTFIKKENTEELIKEFNEYSIVRGDTVVLNRLKAFINDFDLEMPNIDEVKKYYKIV